VRSPAEYQRSGWCGWGAWGTGRVPLRGVRLVEKPCKFFLHRGSTKARFALSQEQQQQKIIITTILHNLHVKQQERGQTVSCRVFLLILIITAITINRDKKEEN
jgi:hypothetical protein